MTKVRKVSYETNENTRQRGDSVSKLIPIELEDGTVIYMESSEDVNDDLLKSFTDPSEEGLVSKGDGMNAAVQKFKSLEATI